ncbi:uncharacterized protein [Lepeophtheirus salmonis]|uniref:uncharacterized protein n=1 Tax=Lepeophtheirus salmonis TaxID=72036 RepID=UPI001AE63A09|nr:pupal cuticle protein 36-like [Lepeophtheirus salmonis]
MNLLAFCTTLLLSSALLVEAGILNTRTKRDSSSPSTTYGYTAIRTFNKQQTSPIATSYNYNTYPVVEVLNEVNKAPGTLGDNSNFENSFEATNGIRQESSGQTVQIGKEDVVVMRGSYKYVGTDGQTYVVDWIADENGFKPFAAHLPKVVPIPYPEIAEAVDAQIVFAAQEKDGSSYFVGNSNSFYDGSSGKFSNGNSNGLSSGSSSTNTNSLSGGRSSGNSNRLSSGSSTDFSSGNSDIFSGGSLIGFSNRNSNSFSSRSLSGFSSDSPREFSDINSGGFSGGLNGNLNGFSSES